MCSDLPNPANGLILFSSPAPYEFGTTATYICNTGYGLSGDVTRTCEGDGSSPTGMWSGALPTCEGKPTMISQVSCTMIVRPLQLLCAMD